MKLLLGKSFEELMAQALERLQQTPITETGPGGIARLILAIINEIAAGIYDTLTINHIQYFVSTATGEYLDAIGVLLNCKRNPNEGDESFRYRITQQTLTLAAANRTAIRLAALSVTGVKDIIERPYTHGTGSFSLYVITDDPVPSDAVLAEVKTVVDEVKGYGIRAEIFRPRLIPVEFHAKLIFEKQAPDLDRKLVISEATQALKDYFNSRTAGDSLVVNEITQIIMNASKYVFDFQVLDYRINGRPSLWFNNDAGWNERFIESSKANAITLS